MAGKPAIKYTFKPCVVSAPGKVILFGEHSVVYGKRALACSLGLRTRLFISPANDFSIQLHLPELHLEKSWPLEGLKNLMLRLRKISPKKSIEKHPHTLTPEEEIEIRSFLGFEKGVVGKNELGLIAFLHLYTNILECAIPFSITVKSEMPVGAGLGSSAAYGVCLAATLMWLSGQLPSKCSDALPELNSLPEEKQRAICEWALMSERVVHGFAASGIDNAVCTYGGCVSFKSGAIQRSTLPPLNILLVNTCVSRNTKALVAGVKERSVRHLSVVMPILDAMDCLAESAQTTFAEMRNNSLSAEALAQKYASLLDLVDINQGLLSALGVSHSTLDTLIATARRHGLHAKLTGAGGGGFGFVLIPPDTPSNRIEACKAALLEAGFESWVTPIAGLGLKFDNA